MKYEVTDVEKILPNEYFDRAMMVGHVMKVSKKPVVGQRFECYDETDKIWFYSSRISDILVESGKMTLLTARTRYELQEKGKGK